MSGLFFEAEKRGEKDQQNQGDSDQIKSGLDHHYLPEGDLNDDAGTLWKIVGLQLPVSQVGLVIEDVLDPVLEINLH